MDGRRNLKRLRRSRDLGAVDQWVELSVPQGDEHRLVLLLHHFPDDLAHPVVLDVLGVARLDALEDAPPVHEEVRDDVAVLDARVFRLDVEDLALVTDVVVVSEEGRRGLRRHGEHRGRGTPPNLPQAHLFRAGGQCSRRRDELNATRCCHPEAEGRRTPRLTWIRGCRGVLRFAQDDGKSFDATGSRVQDALVPDDGREARITAPSELGHPDRERTERRRRDREGSASRRSDTNRRNVRCRGPLQHVCRGRRAHAHEDP